MADWEFVEHGQGGCSWRNPERARLNVIFVHGFRGNHLDTWSWRAKRRFFGQSTSVLLFDLLMGDTTLIPSNFYSIAHEANIGSASGIDQAANWLRTFIRNHVAPDIPIVLVAHSFGGLACRRAILSSLGDDQDPSAIVGLLMMGTPNSGTQIARVAKALGSRAGSDMRPFNDKIKELNRAWTAQVVNGGDPDMDPARRDPLLCRTVIGTQDRVVPEASAVSMASFSTIDTLPKGHIDLVKARDTNDPTYATIARFIHDAAAASVSREAEFALRHLTYRLRKASLDRRWVREERDAITLGQIVGDPNQLLCIARNTRVGGPMIKQFEVAVWISDHRPSGNISYDFEIGQGVMSAADFNQLLAATNGQLSQIFKVTHIKVRNDSQAGAYRYVGMRTGPGWAVLSFEAPDWLSPNDDNIEIELEVEGLVDRRQGWFFYAVPRTVSRRLEVEFSAPFRCSHISRLGRGSRVIGPTQIGNEFVTKALVEGPTSIGRSLVFVYER